jgi:hypothetical protein
MQTFEHKKDLVSIIGLVAIVLILNIYRFINGYGYSVPILVALGVLLVLVTWMWLDSAYTIENEVLKIKSGPFTSEIKINNITRVIKHPRSIFKGKLAKYKLIIVYDKKRQLNVFPIEMDKLISALRKINSDIKVE